MIATLWTKLSGYLATIGIALALIAGAFFYGRADGKDAARTEQARANAKALKKSKEVEDEINGLNDRSVSDSLARWMRDGKR